MPGQERCRWWEHLDVADDEWDDAVEFCQAGDAVDCASLLNLARILTTHGVDRGKRIWELMQDGAPEEWAAAYCSD